MKNGYITSVEFCGDLAVRDEIALDFLKNLHGHSGKHDAYKCTKGGTVIVVLDKSKLRNPKTEKINSQE